MESLDQSLFVLINSTWSNGFFDYLLVPLTDLHKSRLFSQVAVPLLLIFWIFKQRAKVLPVLLGAVICIALVDNFTYRILKPTFKKERPPAIEKEITLRTDRYAGYSFPSNHAANNFAGATFLSYCYPALSPLFYAVASLVAYSRVYVGVHYPSDVLAGALLGLIFGLLFFKIWAIILLKVSTRWPIFQLPAKQREVGEKRNE